MNDVMPAIVGYEWSRTTIDVEIFHYLAQSGQNVFRTISVDLSLRAVLAERLAVDDTGGLLNHLQTF